MSEYSSCGDPSTDAVTVRALTKKFGSVQALEHISADIQWGETVALWGANGAGKSTLLHCLLGLIPYSGTIGLAGFDPAQNGKAVRRRVGFIPQDVTFPATMTIDELVPYYAAFRDTPDEEVERRIDQVGLSSHRQKRGRELSGGLRQRLALAIALLGDPPVLLFDEPTASLDIQGYRDFVQVLGQLTGPDRALVFSSHRIQEVRTLADRVMVLDEGRVVDDCGPAELERELVITP